MLETKPEIQLAFSAHLASSRREILKLALALWIIFWPNGQIRRAGHAVHMAETENLTLLAGRLSIWKGKYW